MEFPGSVSPNIHPKYRQRAIEQASERNHPSQTRPSSKRYEGTFSNVQICPSTWQLHHIWRMKRRNTKTSWIVPKLLSLENSLCQTQRYLQQSILSSIKINSSVQIDGKDQKYHSIPLVDIADLSIKNSGKVRETLQVHYVNLLVMYNSNHCKQVYI